MGLLGVLSEAKTKPVEALQVGAHSQILNLPTLKLKYPRLHNMQITMSFQGQHCSNLLRDLRCSCRRRSTVFGQSTFL
jgi:hypothetical protein